MSRVSCYDNFDLDINDKRDEIDISNHDPYTGEYASITVSKADLRGLILALIGECNQEDRQWLKTYGL